MRARPASDSYSAVAKGLHFSFGMLILIVMAARFVHRLMVPVALEAHDAPAWERFLAKTAHRVFYLILLVGPVLGWASASAHRLPVRPFGIVTLPAIAAPGAHWANTAGDIHGTAMWVLLWLVGLHAAAALFHHLGPDRNARSSVIFFRVDQRRKIGPVHRLDQMGVEAGRQRVSRDVGAAVAAQRDQLDGVAMR